MTTYQIGQRISYRNCSSTFSGIIVALRGDYVIVLHNKAEEILYEAGYAVGSDVHITQIITPCKIDRERLYRIICNKNDFMIEKENSLTEQEYLYHRNILSRAMLLLDRTIKNNTKL